MIHQPELDFSTASPINKEKLSGQNERLYNYLKEGNTIHCFSPAMQRLKIGYLNSRCSDLINKHNITIFKRWIQVKDSDGDTSSVVEYSLTPFKEESKAA